MQYPDADRMTGSAIRSHDSQELQSTKTRIRTNSKLDLSCLEEPPAALRSHAGTWNMQSRQALHHYTLQCPEVTHPGRHS